MVAEGLLPHNPPTPNSRPPAGVAGCPSLAVQAERRSTCMMSAANHTSPGQEDQRVGTPTSADTARQQALEGFRAGGGKHLNCAQSVLLYCLLRLGMDTQPLAAARYLGGGVARQGLTCGLLLGCALGIGARDAGAGGPCEGGESARPVRPRAPL